LRILGIESSCDETAAAVLEDGKKILSSSVASQLDIHVRYGGIVPELASREHLRAIVPVVREAMETAKSSWRDLDAIAVTHGPGLAGSLLVGLTYAKSLCLVHHLPLIGVHHLEGHILAALLEAGGERQDLPFPALALVASGGHTHLFECLAPGRYRLEGRTRDDAAGEAYDKVGKLLGYGYPGGPLIDALAAFGDPRAIRFSSPKMKGNESDFSFSGLKTAVLRWFEASNTAAEVAKRRTLSLGANSPSIEEWRQHTSQQTLDLLASFQYTVIRELLTRALAAAERISARALIISGGVAANQGLRREVASRNLTIPVYFPERRWSTDNAVMIALAGHDRLLRGQVSPLSLRAQANLPLAG
jgi:N6-L-threonylcarbamoyladenine synthase